jgi:hypothetical protein
VLHDRTILTMIRHLPSSIAYMIHDGCITGNWCGRMQVSVRNARHSGLQSLKDIASEDERFRAETEVCTGSSAFFTDRLLQQDNAAICMSCTSA